MGVVSTNLKFIAMFSNSLVLYDSTDIQQRLAALMVTQASNATDFIDVNGQDDSVGTDEINTLVAALDNDTYDKCYIFCPVSDGGGSGDVNYDTFALIRSKMVSSAKGTEVTTGTAGANANTALVVLESGASDSNDTYNDMIIVTDGDVDAVKRILDYTGATRTVEAGGAAFASAVDASETYAVYDVSSTIVEVNAASGGKQISLLAYEDLFPNVGIPQWLQATGLYTFFEDYGQAQAVAAGTITLATATGDGRRCGTGKNDDDYFNGMTVYVYNSTNGKYQKAVISDYVGSTKVATLSANWGTTPTGTVLYRILPAADVDRVYWDLAVERYAELYFNDVTTSDAQAKMKSLIDSGRGDVETREFVSGKADPVFEADMLEKGVFVIEWQRENP